MQWKTRPLGYFSYTVLCCLCKRGDGRAAREGGEHHLFQFTPLREGRPRCGVVCCQILQISIHAPARGATSTGPGKIVDKIHFNSRPCERGDAWLHFRFHKPRRFQFTPLREGRREQPVKKKEIMLFQFTPLREGRQQPKGTSRRFTRISIHAPARGATEYLGGGRYHVNIISIHAPARGATAKLNKICSVFSAIIEKNS